MFTRRHWLYISGRLAFADALALCPTQTVGNAAWRLPQATELASGLAAGLAATDKNPGSGAALLAVGEGWTATPSQFPGFNATFHTDSATPGNQQSGSPAGLVCVAP